MLSKVINYFKSLFKPKPDTNTDMYLSDVIKDIDTLISKNISPYKFPYASVRVVTHFKCVLDSLKINKAIAEIDYTQPGAYTDISTLVPDTTYMLPLNRWYSNRATYIVDKSIFNLWLTSIKELIHLKHAMIIRNKEIINLAKIDFLIQEYIVIIEQLKPLKTYIKDK